MWWTRHLWVVGMQITAFLPYCIGSCKFYRRKKHFMWWIGTGIVLNCIMAITASTGMLPRMSSEQGAPWTSILFLLHIILSGGGMFAFIIMFFFLIKSGVNKEYPLLRWVQYRIFLNMWIAGVSMALFNFVFKILFEQRIYDMPWQMF